MRPRLPVRRIFLLRSFRPPNYSHPRLFTQNTLSSTRPQLPFLSIPNRRPPQSRLISTETKKWIKSEVKLAAKWITLFYTTAGLLVIMAFGVQQEWLERTYPTPPCWSWISRKDFRSWIWDVDGADDPYPEDGGKIVDWVWSGLCFQRLLERLENPNIDGKGLKLQGGDEGEEGVGILVEGIGKTGYDITAKEESWRRGYYGALMGAARAAEHTDGWVKDRSRNGMAFAPDVVIGPSNPDPKPVPLWSKDAPREENCDYDAFIGPEVFYLKALTTRGFTAKQRMDAALAYGSWLDFKGTKETAREMYRWALDIATEDTDSSSTHTSKSILDKKTGIINTNAGIPSANILVATTALAVHHAVNSELQQALPIFLSILRARRTLQDPPKTMLASLTPDEEPGLWKRFGSFVQYIMIPPDYPPPPDDGTAPPLRTPKQKCEEAGVMAYIGEILYASQNSKKNREDGLAWTREAVDLAEEEFRNRDIDKDAKRTCRQCLEVGLENWTTMVKRMAREEREKRDANPGGSWLGFGSKEKEGLGRWESEEVVIKERVRRVREAIEGRVERRPTSGLLQV